MTRKLFGLMVLIVFAMNVHAQRSIDGIQFMIDQEQAVELLKTKFGEPVSTTNDKIVYKNIAIDGESYNEADFQFDSKGRMYIMRLKSYCSDSKKSATRMNALGKKYGAIYKTTASEDPDDGKFIVGYDKDGARLFTIASYKNRCDMTFGPF